ncbi:MAG TPA: hypothetical protein VER32_13505, partial [Pyrinomonadaceae bacterium]|nr:hypothetical protein [Pyrinomonadaceae bacterium]
GAAFARVGLSGGGALRSLFHLVGLGLAGKDMSRAASNQVAGAGARAVAQRRPFLILLGRTTQ